MEVLPRCRKTMTDDCRRTSDGHHPMVAIGLREQVVIKGYFCCRKWFLLAFLPKWDKKIKNGHGLFFIVIIVYILIMPVYHIIRILIRICAAKVRTIFGGAMWLLGDFFIFCFYNTMKIKIIKIIRMKIWGNLGQFGGIRRHTINDNQ